MTAVYAAHTESGTLMLDENGVCEWVAPTGQGKTPERIVGAQFVASLDVNAPGALVGAPREGVPMLFAAADENGHISLLRTANLLRFEDKRDSGIRMVTPRRPSLEEIAPRGVRAPLSPLPPSSNNYAPPRLNAREVREGTTRTRR